MKKLIGWAMVGALVITSLLTYVLWKMIKDL